MKVIILDMPLLRLSKEAVSTLWEASRSVRVFGGTGSGKSSATAGQFATAYARAGLGELMVASRQDDVACWKRSVREAGRNNDVVLFRGGVE